MNTKMIAASLLATGVLIAGGVGLYHMGMQAGMAQTPNEGHAGHAPSAASTATPTAPAQALIDPSSWGIPEGEDATRRHMKDGIKAGDTDPVTGRKVLYYHDPMMPGQKFDAPAKSPFMEMMLVPAYAGGAGADNGTLSISPRIQQNLGIRIGEAIQDALSEDVSAVGAIAWNERGQVTLQARATGFVEKLHVRATLDSVVKGQPLFDLYVPEWVAVQEDYLSVRRMAGSDLASLVDAAQQRMRQAGMDEAQIALVKRSGKVQARFTMHAPISGVVTELTAREGSTVMPGMLLARINDLSTVWAQAEVPESQAAHVHEGDVVRATSPALAGQHFEGTVQALLPDINPMTRTRKARVELRNPNKLLVPGMFVQMRLTDRQARLALLVPSEALIRSGKRTLVMVVDNDSFRPVEVQVGVEQNGRSEILSGLNNEQKIVLSGQFLIDSEASLKGVEARLGSEEAGMSDMAEMGGMNTMGTMGTMPSMQGMTTGDAP